MKILVDNLYFGSVWASSPTISYDGELITGVKYTMEKESDPFLLRIAEDKDDSSDMKLAAYSIDSTRKFSLQPSLSNRKTYIVNPNELKSLRATFPSVHFPIFLEEHKAEKISDIYSSLSVRAKILGLNKKEAKETITKEIKMLLKEK